VITRVCVWVSLSGGRAPRCTCTRAAALVLFRSWIARRMALLTHAVQGGRGQIS
jgi:hypothetical protein